MEKQEFTKEELLKAKQVLESFQKQVTGYSFPEWIDLQLKPETKKIIVEIEYKPIPDFITNEPNIELRVNDVRDCLNQRMNEEFNIKVTELPEAFTREDMIKMLEHSSYSEKYATDIVDIWLTERNQNE